MVVAYSVGEDLTKYQLIFINSIFLVFSVMLSLAVYIYFRGAYQLGVAYRPESSPQSESVLIYIFLLTKIAAVLGALKFMFDTRKKH